VLAGEADAGSWDPRSKSYRRRDGHLGTGSCKLLAGTATSVSRGLDNYSLVEELSRPNPRERRSRPESMGRGSGSDRTCSGQGSTHSRRSTRLRSPQDRISGAEHLSRQPGARFRSWGRPHSSYRKSIPPVEGAGRRCGEPIVHELHWAGRAEGYVRRPGAAPAQGGS